MFDDLKFALRQLRRSPGFSVTAVLTLAVGIGGVAAFFSIVDAVLLRPLPFHEPDRLVRLHEGVEHEFDPADLPAPDVVQMMRDNRTFSAVAGFLASAYELNGAGAPFQARGERVSASLFPMLGAQPFLGRTFTQAEDEHSAPVALISYALWRERFQSDPGAVGRTVNLDRRPYTIIGVMPRSFEFPLEAGGLNHRDVWVPMSFTPDEKQDETNNFMYGAIARLKPGVSLEQARSDVHRIIAGIEAQIPPKDGIHLTSSVSGLREETVQRARPLLQTLMGASILILCIACVNLANLLLARGATRKREFGVRLALGAGSGAMLRQLLGESLLLSILGGAFGTVLAVDLVHVMVTGLPDWMPRLEEVGVRWPMLAVALGLAALTGLLCGLAPAMGSMRTEILDALREGSQGAGRSRAQHRFQNALVMVEVALALVLLVASGLLLRSFQKMLETDPGFQPEQVLTAYLSLPETGYLQQSRIDSFYQELLRRLGALPGTSAVGISSSVPTGGIRSDRNFVPEGFASHGSGRQWGSASNSFVMGDYFRAMRIPLLRGRYLIAADDQPGAPLVAVVSQSLAQRYWPDQDPVGKRFKMGGNPQSTRPSLTVVGVVGDIRQGAMDQATYPQMYEPVSQFARQFEPEVAKSIGAIGSFYIAVRSAGAPETLAASVEKTVHQLDPLLAVSQVHTMAERVAATEAPRRFNTAILTAFAGIALLLALLGIYGVLACAVAERTREIAIRIALGATRGDVLRETIRSVLMLAGVGVGIGLAASAGLMHFLESLLYGVTPLDAVAIAGAAALLLACAALAGWIPARRAASVDPMDALRSE